MKWIHRLMPCAAAMLLVVSEGVLAEPPAPAPAPAADAPAAAEPAPATTPQAAPAAQDTAPEPKKGPDLAPLRAQLSTVLDELIQARTRAAVLVKTLFRTRVEVYAVQRADDQRITHVALRLDGVPVHDSDGAALARGDDSKLFDGHAAPGVHELTLVVTQQANANATYQVTREERFRFEIKKDTRTRVDLVIRDDSDMAEELPQGDDGEYDVRTIMRIEQKPANED